MNYFEVIAKLLDLELEEEFKIRNYTWVHKLTKEGLKKRFLNSDTFDTTNVEFNDLTPENIIKLPWKPKRGEVYWTINFMFDEGVECYKYREDEEDEIIFERDLGFKTEKEAINKFEEVMELLKGGK